MILCSIGLTIPNLQPSTASSRSAASSTCLSDMITAVGEKLISFNISNNKMAGLPFVFKAISVREYIFRLTFIFVYPNTPIVSSLRQIFSL